MAKENSWNLIQVATIWDNVSKAGRPYKTLQFLQSKFSLPCFAGESARGKSLHNVYVNPEDTDTLIDELQEVIKFLKEKQNATEEDFL